MNFTFEIYKCEFCSFLLFLQGNFQEKLNKLESESENKGGSYNFGRFLNFQFTTELAPQCIVALSNGVGRCVFDLFNKIFWFIRLWKKRHWISLLRKCGQFVETRPFCAECRLATDSHFKVPSRFLYIQFLSKHHSNTGNWWLIWMFLFFKALSTEKVRRFNVSVICFMFFFPDLIYLPGSIAIWVKSAADPHPLPFIRSAPLSLLLLFTRLFFISHINGFNKEKTLGLYKIQGISLLFVPSEVWRRNRMTHRFYG